LIQELPDIYEKLWPFFFLWIYSMAGKQYNMHLDLNPAAPRVGDELGNTKIFKKYLLLPFNIV
jgi:hypothetical protein